MANWRRIKAFFARLHSPCYIVCGNLEEPTVFQRELDARPVGSFDYGGYRFVLMLDTQRHPVNQHRSNVEAVLQNLSAAGDAIPK